MGIPGFGGPCTAIISGGLNGTIVLQDFEQYGFTLPVHCILDTICLTVGNLAIPSAADQDLHIFAMLATAQGNSQLFTLQPDAKAEVILLGSASHSTQVSTVRAGGLGFGLTAETRCMIVCGHYTAGATGPTSHVFTYSGTLLFK